MAQMSFLLFPPLKFSAMTSEYGSRSRVFLINSL
jgi:hypothetical protein